MKNLLALIALIAVIALGEGCTSIPTTTTTTEVKVEVDKMEFQKMDCLLQEAQETLLLAPEQQSMLRRMQHRLLQAWKATSPEEVRGYVSLMYYTGEDDLRMLVDYGVHREVLKKVRSQSQKLWKLTR